MFTAENARMGNLVPTPLITKDIRCGLRIPSSSLRKQNTPGAVKDVTLPATAEVENVHAFLAAAVIGRVDYGTMLATATKEGIFVTVHIEHIGVFDGDRAY